MKHHTVLGHAHRLCITLTFLLLVLGAWELASHRPHAPDYFLGPVEILQEAARSLLHGEVIVPAAHSLYRAYAGFLVGGLVGLAMGLLSGVSRPLRELFDVPQAFVHAIPKISPFPAVAVWLGFTDASRILIIALSCFFPAYLNAMSGALSINPRYLWLSRNNEATSFATFVQIVLPASLPRAMVGLRISLMVAFILMVATEVIGHSNGLGTMVMNAYQNGEYRQMYAAILLIAVAGFVSNLGMERLSTRLCRGQNLATGG